MQELYDDLVCSLKLSEDKKMLLPIVIHIDSILASTREQLEVLTKKMVENFLEEFAIEKPEKRIKHFFDDSLQSLAILQKSTENIEKLVESVSDSWKKRTKREFSKTESYMIQDSEYMLFSYSSIKSPLSSIEFFIIFTYNVSDGEYKELSNK